MYTSLNINSNLLKIVLKIEDKIEGKIKEFEKLVSGKNGDHGQGHP